MFLEINGESLLLGGLLFLLMFVPFLLWWAFRRQRMFQEQIQALKIEQAHLVEGVRHGENSYRLALDELEDLRALVKSQGEAVVLAEERNHKLQQLEHEHQRAQQEILRLQTRYAETITQLSQEKKQNEEKAAFLEETKQRLADAFRALSADALQKNNQAFLDLARTSLQQFQEHAKVDLGTRQKEIAEMVSPIQKALTNVDVKLQELEKERASAYHVLRQQVSDLIQTQQQLRTETAHLVQALKSPSTRGRWGEMQLKRVVEMAGMMAYCDFVEQVQASHEEGKMRPDMVVRLPGGKQVVIDAKAPLAAYLEAMDAKDDATRQARLRDHARQVKNHISALSRRAYWEQFEPTPDFVILFLPGETFFSAALEQDPSLIEAGVQEKVILATPTTLIAMLRAISYGWRQEKLAANAKEIGDLGRELYKRLSDLGGHFGRLGRNLGTAVEAYNQVVGTLERRVLVTARRFQQLETMPEEAPLAEAIPLEQTPRSLAALELITPPEESSIDVPTEKKPHPHTTALSKDQL